VLLLMAAASAGYVCRVAITVVAPGVMHDFALSQTQMGTVFRPSSSVTRSFKFHRVGLPMA
jgi:hypothetical protein